MLSPKVVFNAANVLTSNIVKTTAPNRLKYNYYIEYSKKVSKGEEQTGCSRAIVDIPPKVDPVCPKPCDRRKAEKQGILHRIKLKIIEGGTNFGTPFRRIKCEKTVCKEVAIPESEPVPEPVREVPPIPPPRPGVQVSILGADTNLGQYIALLLKQCPCIKKLRLYETRDTRNSECCRDLSNVVSDLHHIDTNCQVQAFSCTNNELGRCLQNSDIVLMLENACVSMDMPYEDRFNCQAPIVKQYADAISAECPKAFIVVCATPIDCMVPLIAETLKETGWYDPRRLLGSLAVPEMRASTLAARALCLEPSYIKVPCVGGTEGNSLVPLFSKAVEYFDFTMQNAEMMTETVRGTSMALTRCHGNCAKAAELSEAHALAGLVTKVAWAQLCIVVPRVSGYVETDPSLVISPARFLGIDVLLNNEGICKQFDIPRKLNPLELKLMDEAFTNLTYNVEETLKWHNEYVQAEANTGKLQARNNFFHCRKNEIVENCLHNA